MLDAVSAPQAALQDGMIQEFLVQNHLMEEVLDLDLISMIAKIWDTNTLLSSVMFAMIN